MWLLTLNRLWLLLLLFAAVNFLARCQLDYPTFKISFQQFEKSVQIIQRE